MAVAAANGCNGGSDHRTPSPAPVEVPPHHQYSFPSTHAAPEYSAAQQEYENYMQQEVRPPSLNQNAPQYVVVP